MKPQNLCTVVVLSLCWLLVFPGMSLGDDAPVAGVMADPSMESEGVGADPVLSAEGSTVPQAADPGGWVRKYPPQPRDVSAGASDVAVDGAGNVHITGIMETGILTVKYDNAGKLRWARRIGREKGAASSCITVDGSGNVYVAGKIKSSSGFSDFITIKYNSSGVYQWSKTFRGPADRDGYAMAVAVDGSGNVYVAGCSTNADPIPFFADLVVIKYAPDGKRQWVRRHKNGYLVRGCRCMALDGAGNVYVTASTTDGDDGILTVKYDKTGELRWETLYKGYGSCAIAVDRAGNAHVVGASQGTANDRYAVLKYDAGGNLQWSETFPYGPASFYWADIALDGSGGVYVSGIAKGSDSCYGYLTWKYDSNGVRQWTRRYRGVSENDISSPAMAVDGSGSVHVTGGLAGKNSSLDFATVKYDTDGIRQWTRRYNGTGNLDDRATSIALDAAGNAFVTGISYRTDAIFEAVTIKIPATTGRAAGK
ncbi:hypothetical protein [Syntrophobacter fumaroxidans]|uniref:Beta-propeller repeat protein n=1 Tax=Syntrophobacter fumaroxidans (strain DSM 10017 / MPOB) TaxID=335543 RepID=A0LLJ0_SYNFM|nr:hypothetical protein [Syntrophobacter fumaroxidans]ABK18292.1 hypothetical protein Sfum_2614 [Syntrophobacter fumaroxidans MPOB]